MANETFAALYDQFAANYAPIPWVEAEINALILAEAPMKEMIQALAKALDRIEDKLDRVNHPPIVIREFNPPAPVPAQPPVFPLPHIQPFKPVQPFTPPDSWSFDVAAQTQADRVVDADGEL